MMDIVSAKQVVEMYINHNLEIKHVSLVEIIWNMNIRLNIIYVNVQLVMLRRLILCCWESVFLSVGMEYSLNRMNNVMILIFIITMDVTVIVVYKLISNVQKRRHPNVFFTLISTSLSLCTFKEFSVKIKASYTS